MPKTALNLLSAAVLAVLSLAIDAPVCAADSGNLMTADYTDWQFDGYLEIPEIPEPSGMCYHPGRNTLFVVDDGGLLADGSFREPAVFEVSLNLEVLNKRNLGNDLEGICWCSRDGQLYIADETDEHVYIVDPDGLEVRGDFHVARDYQGVELLIAGGNGFEGIEYIPGSDESAGYFLLLNQDDPHALVRIEYTDIPAAADGQTVSITGYHPLPAINLGELFYDADHRELWVVHSWMNVMEILDIDTLVLKRWEVCPGAAQEALTLDGEGRLWIGYDLGGISRYILTTQ